MMFHTAVLTIKRFTLILLAALSFLSASAAAAGDSLTIRIDPEKAKQLPGIDEIIKSMTPPIWERLRSNIEKDDVTASIKLDFVCISAQGLLDNSGENGAYVYLKGPKPAQVRYLLKYTLEKSGWKYTEKTNGKSSVYCLTPPQGNAADRIYAILPDDTDSVILASDPAHVKQVPAKTADAISGEMSFPPGSFPHPALKNAKQIRFVFSRFEHADGTPRLKGTIVIEEKDPEAAKRLYLEAASFFMTTYQQAASQGQVTAKHREMFQARMNGNEAEIILMLDAETAQAFFELLGNCLRKNLK